MNRNIITAADAERLRKNFVASLGDRAFGERMLGEPGVPTPPAPPSPDTWYQRLAKYIPAEALSLYPVLIAVCNQQISATKVS